MWRQTCLELRAGGAAASSSASLPSATSLSIDAPVTTLVTLPPTNTSLVVAGAGMSVDSGLPAFRGEGGFYYFGGAQIAMTDVDLHPELAI